jgi:hypothetical protein
MTNTKTLMLAAVAALSLTAGTAMARDVGRFQVRDLFAEPIPLFNQSDFARAQVQSGSSDLLPEEMGANHSAEFILEHHLYGAGGVGG